MPYSVNELTHGIIHQKELKVSLRRGMPSKKKARKIALLFLQRDRGYIEKQKTQHETH
jgi:hypothetical protein